MPNNFKGKYKVINGGQILGTTVLLDAGDTFDVSGEDDTKATIVFAASNGGHLKNNRDGKLVFRDGASKAIGVVFAPKPSATNPDPAEYVQYQIRLGVNGTDPRRTFDILLMTIGGPSDDNSGEWDGEDEP